MDAGMSLLLAGVFVVLAVLLLLQCRMFHRQGQAAHDAAMQRYGEARAMLLQAEQLHAEAVRLRQARPPLCAVCGLASLDEGD